MIHVPTGVRVSSTELVAMDDLVRACANRLVPYYITHVKRPDGFHVLQIESAIRSWYTVGSNLEALACNIEDVITHEARDPTHVDALGRATYLEVYQGKCPGL